MRLFFKRAVQVGDSTLGPGEAEVPDGMALSLLKSGEAEAVKAERAEHAVLPEAEE